MKLQNLVVIFSIIVIPITLILSAYIGIQIDTALLQQKYDTKLIDATHDAVVAFELNTINNNYSTNADSIRRDIKAAITTFSTSLTTGFGISGSGSSSVMPYIPALVFTLYDGYYIYSPHEYNYEANGETKTGYEHILKPYIHYTGRYKNGNNDIVVNYSLDNYVTIYGYLNNEYKSYAGYLIDTSKLITNNGIVTGYRTNKGTFTINEETLSEFDENGNTIKKQSNSAKQFYQEAYDFTNWVTSNSSLLSTVTPQYAIKSDGSKYEGFANDNTYILNISSTNDAEERASAFTQHKREIMKISIQENLNNAILVYNQNAPSMGTHYDFKMPILTEDDWEKILTNINMISFMQGMPAGTKIYNNYTIVTSTQNKQHINANSIYFVVEGDNAYHRIHCPQLATVIAQEKQAIGYKSVDFRRLQNSAGTRYYYKHPEMACYTCIVNPLREDINISELSLALQKSYYMTLAREKYDLDKITKMVKYSK